MEPQAMEAFFSRQLRYQSAGSSYVGNFSKELKELQKVP